MPSMEDNVFYERSMSTNASTLADQYANGTAAKVWNSFIGDRNNRTRHYKDRLVALLRAHGCKKILDVATGTGVDSIMLCEEGFQVTSIDASDKMLKEALKVRWARRKEAAFDDWVIMEANWLTLAKDLSPILGGGFDAIICIGNSFAHMPDFNGDKKIQRLALQNFEKCVKPGGLLIIDHRNYDHILDFGAAPPKCIYYNSDCESEIKTSILYVDGCPKLVTLDYFVNPSSKKRDNNSDGEKSSDSEGENYSTDQIEAIENKVSKFHLSCYPHRYKVFAETLKEVFGNSAKHTVYGDYKRMDEITENDPPGFFIHVMEKA